jgi:pimeloyl-ACP methyl ester carboxylesterase
MQLEVLHASGHGRSRPVDLLLVHGICVGAWVWERHFLPAFAAAGYNVHAVSLRGHAGSPGRKDLAGFGLSEFAEDLAEVTRSIGRPVVAVGHSLGGAVVQNAIAAGTPFAGGVLMASVPPYGLLAANLAMLARKPLLWREIVRMSVSGIRQADPAVMRDGLFANRISPEAFAMFAAFAHDESPRVALELQGFRPFAPPLWLAPPMLVLGGTEDRFVGVSDLWMTAAWYGTVPVVLSDLSHTIMWDPLWQRAADAVLGWLEQSGLAGA